MKKLFAIFSLLLLCSACSDKDNTGSDTSYKLSSDDPAVMIILDGSSAIVNLPSPSLIGSGAVLQIESNSQINIKSDTEWCIASLDGNKIVLEAVSTTDVDRRTEVSLMSGGTTIGKIIVKQSANPTIEAEVDEIEAPSEGEAYEIAVSTNQTTWSAASDAAWITATASAGKLKLEVAPNTQGERTGIVTLATGLGANRATATITVKQESNGMVLEYTLTNPGTTVILHTTGNVDCQVDWGDGTKESYKETINSMSNRISHVYERAGVYLVSISGITPVFGAGMGVTTQSLEALTAVKKWGYLGITTMENAFYNCTNLASIPENTQNAFRDVTSFKYAFWKTALKSIPASLFKGCEKATLFTFCFSGTQISEIPAELFNETPNATNFQSTFSNNPNLTKIPAGLFDKTPNVDNFSTCFQLNTALTEIPAGLFRNLTKVTNFKDLFYGCKTLTKVPDELFAGSSGPAQFNGIFQNCSALTTIGNNVFKGCTEATSFKSTFFGCVALEHVPVNIFDDCMKVKDFGGTFRNNSNPNVAKWTSESPYTMINGTKVHLYERVNHPTVFTKPTTTSGCFYGCTALTDWNTINTNFTTWR